MPDNKVGNTAGPQVITPSEWALVLAAIPGAQEAPDPAKIQSHVEIQSFDGPAVLPGDGMYIVLEGTVSLRLKGEDLATAKQGDYFYEEHLEIDDIPVELEAHAQPGAKLAHLSYDEWLELPEEIRKQCLASLFGDLVNVHMHNFQQPINCCNVPAAALSLTALGFSCEVNDIFRDCSLPVSYVVNEGMSLSELYDVACTYIHTQGLQDLVNVQVYFFDEDITSEQMLIDAIAESDRVGGEDDILVPNFNVGIAHGNPAIKGGHFALLAKCNPSTGLVHMMDVHPEKYGKLWVTTTKRLYEAMSDRDGSSMRSRGLIRFSARHAVSSRLETLSQDCIYVDHTQHLDVPQDSRRYLFRRSSTNLNSIGVLTESLGLLGDADVSEDRFLQSSGVSYSDALSRESTAMELAVVANQYLAETENVRISCRHSSYQERTDDAETSPQEWFKARLLELTEDTPRHLMINIDLNNVLGYEAVSSPDEKYRETALLREFWCLCTGYDATTDMVTVVDTSPTTTQVWQAPLANLFRGLRNLEDPAMLVLEQRELDRDSLDFAQIVAVHPMVLFYTEDDPWSFMLKSILANIGITDVHLVDVSEFDTSVIKLRNQLVINSGKDSAPYLYFQGASLGDTDDIVSMVNAGTLQKMVHDAGLPVLMRSETPSLDRNIFSYPKGGLTEAPNGKRNVLLSACGSSAADKIPELVERLVDAGHNVKLVPSASAEHFFKDIGMDRVLNKIRASDIYRDDDEWNFRYTEFGMPLRAAHLALCDWADRIIVAPITCNTMGKVAHGIADNLLSSVFVAWQYQRKPVILCPACNTHMWNNITTQNNVALLKRLGAHIEGPRSGILSNGTVGTGMMATPDEIMAALDTAFLDLDDQDSRIMKWGRDAAAVDDIREWKRIFRAIDEDVVGINIIDDETGDTLLHYAAGGEGEMTEDGIEKGVPDLDVALELIARGIDVDAVNDFGFSSLHVAMMNDSAEMVKILLDADANAESCIAFMDEVDISADVRALLTAWAAENNVEISGNERREGTRSEGKNGARHLYFTYGSLKRGFPNHEAHREILAQYVGAGSTRQAMPLIVPREPYCDNPNCPYLHRMAALVDLKGKGRRVAGEVYRVDDAGLRALDSLEGYFGPRHPDNVYERKTISVQVDGKPETAFVYVVADPEQHLKDLETGTSEIVSEYTMDMAVGVLKPGYEDAST